MSLVSIIIPAYNTERYIRKCVESVMAQTYKNIEIIIINDGSSDSTASIIEELKLKDNRIIVIHQNNGGIGAARKTGLSIAKGKYFQFIDSDDWVENNYIEKMYILAEEYAADIVESGGAFCHDQYGLMTKAGKIQDGKISVLNPKKVAMKIVRRLHSCTLWTKFFRREFCTENHIDFEEGIDFGEDAHFICKACYHDPKYIYINKKFYHVRNNPTSVTKTRYTRKNFACRMAWINDLYLNIEDQEFRDALNTMKFFIREEAALSQLYSQTDYKLIFPEILSLLPTVRVGFIRKLFLRIATLTNNQKVGYIESRNLVKLSIRINDFLYRKSHRLS